MFIKKINKSVVFVYVLACAYNVCMFSIKCTCVCVGVGDSCEAFGV